MNNPLFSNIVPPYPTEYIPATPQMDQRFDQVAPEMFDTKSALEEKLGGVFQVMGGSLLATVIVFALVWYFFRKI